MVDSEARHQLSQDVRRLITGRATNVDFDEAYDDSFHASDDLAIREISRFFWGLYSSDTLLPYRLRGRHAVDAETRQAASRAVLFLQTLQAQWSRRGIGILPRNPHEPKDRTLAALISRVVGQPTETATQCRPRAT